MDREGEGQDDRDRPLTIQYVLEASNRRKGENVFDSILMQRACVGYISYVRVTDRVCKGGGESSSLPIPNSKRAFSK